MSVIRPCPSTDRSVDRDQQRALSFSRSTAFGRPFTCHDRSTVNQARPVHVVHTDRPGGRPGPVPWLAASCVLALFWLPISALFLPMNLKKLLRYILCPLSPLSPYMVMDYIALVGLSISKTLQRLVCDGSMAGPRFIEQALPLLVRRSGFSSSERMIGPSEAATKSTKCCFLTGSGGMHGGAETLTPTKGKGVSQDDLHGYLAYLTYATKGTQIYAHFRLFHEILLKTHILV